MIRSSERGCCCRRCVPLVVVILAVGVPAAGQDRADAEASDASDLMTRPSEYGVRFTPPMARSFARIFTRSEIADRYEMSDEQTDAAAEIIARELMRYAHSVEESGQGLTEFVLENAMRFEAQSTAGRPQSHHEVSQKLMQGASGHLQSMLPAMRELVRNVGQDLRPLLPLKQQLKLAGDLALMKTGIDAFEKNVERWSAGDLRQTGSPFRNDVRVDENGESWQFKRARTRAEERVAPEPWDKWREYVNNAKEFYGFDQAQLATAESILREAIQKGQIVQQDTAFRERLYRQTLWSEMSRYLGFNWGHPLGDFIEQDAKETLEPLGSILDDLKARIETIPTEAQRRQAEQKVIALFAEEGFDVDGEGVQP